LPCMVAGFTMNWGLPGAVKSNIAFQIINTEEPDYS